MFGLLAYIPYRLQYALGWRPRSVASHRMAVCLFSRACVFIQCTYWMY